VLIVRKGATPAAGAVPEQSLRPIGGLTFESVEDLDCRA
jgi:hypothetical protein